MMASRLLYGMANHGVLPSFLGRVHSSRRTPWASILVTTVIALGLITYVSLDTEGSVVALLGGTTSLLLLAVFTVVNAVVLVLRRDHVDHKHFEAGRVLPVIGAVACAYLVLPWSSGRPVEQYQIAGVLLVIGVVLFALTWVVRRLAGSPTRISDDADDLTTKAE
jgi:APA family basic amino acid/polyamine antiporter